MTDGIVAIDSLPDDVLVRILGLLQPCQLHWTERVNKRFRNTVVQHDLWRKHCIRCCSNFEEIVQNVDVQSLQQIITDLQDMAAAEAEALAEPSNSLGSTIMRSSTRVLRSDSDLQRSKPPITVTPFWGPGLSTAAKPIVTSATSNPPVNSVEAFKAASWRPRSYSRDGNLSTSRDASRDSSRHGANNFWQFSSSLTSELLRSMFYKRLCWLLGARPAEHSLIAKAVQASSTDNVEEGIQNVLRPDTQRIAMWVTYSYWSSAASDDADSTETLDFELAHPLCLATEVHIRPFRADFQDGSPIYPAKQVRFHFGTLEPQSEEDLPAKFRALYSSPVYPMQHRSELQGFALPSVLAVGGAMRVELIGRMQRQPAPADNRFYTCIDYVKLVGTPLYGFEPCNGHLALTQRVSTTAGGSEGLRGAVVLKAVWVDALTQAGGLLHVSEMGRHVSSNQVPGLDAGSDDEGQNGLHGDSDDGDFANEQANLYDTDSSDDEAIQHGAGFIIGQQLALHPMEHIAGPLDPHDHDGEYPVMYD